MKTYIKECILVFFTGIVPAGIILSRGGVESLKSFVKAAIVPETIFYYFLLFFVCHCILAFLYKPYIGNVSPKRRDNVRNKIIIFGEIGGGLLGIYRLASGLLIGIPVLWYIYDRDTLSNVQLFAMLGYSLIFFFGICAISSINRAANKRLSQGD